MNDLGLDLGLFAQRAPLALGTDGNFFGTTPYGGVDGAGSVFLLTPTGVLDVFFSFDLATYGNGEYESADPTGLVQDGLWHLLRHDPRRRFAGPGHDFPGHHSRVC